EASPSSRGSTRRRHALCTSTCPPPVWPELLQTLMAEPPMPRTRRQRVLWHKKTIELSVSWSVSLDFTPRFLQRQSGWSKRPHGGVGGTTRNATAVIPLSVLKF